MANSAHEKKLEDIRQKYEVEIATLRDLHTHSEVETPVKLKTGWENFIYCDNIPVVPAAKLSKLQSVLQKKVFGKVGTLAPNGLFIPQSEGEKSKTLGFCIVEYEKTEDAVKAVKSLDGLKLDPKHQFRVNRYQDVIDADETSEEFSITEVKIAERPLLKHWLLDARGIDQLMLHVGERMEVVWNTVDYRLGWNDPAQRSLETYVEKERFPMKFATWSPSGTFLATVHGAGVALWGGPADNWTNLQKFDHKNAERLAFSPNEKFLVTVSTPGAGGKKTKKSADVVRTVIIHSIDTGRRIKVFEGLKSSEWPIFKFSSDDSWFAGMGKNKIRVFDTDTMELQRGKAMKVPGVQSFSVSPGSSMLAYYVPEKENHPAQISVIELPSRRMVAQKSFFKVKTCHLLWHPSGNFLCAKVDRDNKTGKKQFTMLVLFRVSDKNVPVEIVEFDTETVVTAFAWQPSGNRFAVIHGGTSAAAKPDVSVHSMSGKQVKLEKTFSSRTCNTLLWAPTEPYLVLANHKQAGGGQLEFINAVLKESMGTGESSTATAYYWSPRSRFFVTVSSAWRHNMETGFFLYSFNGKLLMKNFQDRFYDVKWRPRPASLLSAAEEKRIKKKMKDYTSEFKREDEMRTRLEKRDFYVARTKARADFYKRLEERRAEQENISAGSQEEEYEMVEEKRQEVVSETVTMV